MSIRKYALMSSVASAALLLDQATKYIFTAILTGGKEIAVLENVLYLRLVHNFGAGFGILQGMRWPLVWLAVFVLGLMIFCSERIKEDERLLQASFGLVIGGTLGNLVDRVFMGYVVDFISFSFWPAFNIADSALTAGAVMLIAALFRRKEKGHRP